MFGKNVDREFLLIMIYMFGNDLKKIDSVSIQLFNLGKENNLLNTSLL